jgi:ADP-ribosylation factor-like protein 13B
MMAYSDASILYQKLICTSSHAHQLLIKFRILGNGEIFKSTIMGTIQDKFKSKRDIVIALLGLDGAGKSTLMQSLTEDESDEDEEPLATIGYSTRTLSVGRYNVTMTEVGGGNDIRGIWPKYFAQCYGLIYMVDGSSNRNRIDESRRELRNILLDPRMKCKPLLVLCNKADLPNTMGADELINAFSLHEMLQESVNNGPPVSIEPKVRVWICSCLKVKGSGKKDRRLMLSLKWLLKQITTDWEELSARVSEQHGLELEEKERERQERIKERRRRREEAERYN